MCDDYKNPKVKICSVCYDEAVIYFDLLAYTICFNCVTSLIEDLRCKVNK